MGWTGNVGRSVSQVDRGVSRRVWVDKDVGRSAYGVDKKWVGVPMGVDNDVGRGAYEVNKFVCLKFFIHHN